MRTPWRLRGATTTPAPTSWYFYDITASVEGRGLFTDVLRDVARQIFIPLTVGGAINTLEDFRPGAQGGCGQGERQFRGPSKTRALIGRGCEEIRRPCVVLSMDVARVDGKSPPVRQKAGARIPVWTHWNGLCAAKPGGAGEIVLNSIDTDGVKLGV